MRHGFTTILLVCVLLLSVTGAVAAQETTQNTTNNSTDTETPSPTQTPSETPTQESTPTPSDADDTTNQTASTEPSDGNNETAIAQLDSATRVMDYDVRGSTLHIWFHSTEDNRVTVTETQNGEGVTEVSVGQERLSEGRYHMTIALNSDDSTVLITSPESLRNERAISISPSSGTTLIGGPYSSSDLRDAAIGGALAVVLSTAYVAARRKTNSKSGGDRIR